jgi:hypothetical protein
MALIVGGRDNNERRHRNNADKGKMKNSERAFPSATFSSRNVTLAVLEQAPGSCGKKPKNIYSEPFSRPNF